MSRVEDAPLEFNPFLPEMRADPYPLYHRLRFQDPVHQSFPGVWILTRYDDCVAVLRDPGRFSNDSRNSDLYQAFRAARGREPTIMEDTAGRTMLFIDPPEHARLRNLVNKAFTARRIEALRPHVGEIVKGLLDDIEASGQETTVDLIGNGMLALLRHRDQLERLTTIPSLISSATEEFLRYDSPVQLLGRTLMEDVEIGGRHIRKGEQLVPVIGAANRDPAQFSEPDILDIGRPDNRHLSFGCGIYFCLGAPLARAEGQITIVELIRHFPNLELATETFERRETVTLRGLRSLPVAVN